MLSVVNNLSILLKSDVSGRISLLVNAQVLEKCVHLPMSQYDNETTYNRIRFTSEQTSIRFLDRAMLNFFCERGMRTCFI